MKTRNLGQTLKAFAAMFASGTDGGLEKLASVFSQGVDETLAARAKTWSKAAGHPAVLRSHLEAIQTALGAAGAAKQAAAIGTLLKTFSGPGNLAVDEFISQITAPKASARPNARRSAAPPQIDEALARKLADELAKAVLDTRSFEQILHRLDDGKFINTPTLASVANRFLGNTKTYSGRKAPIEEIVRRQKADVREYATGKALSRVGV